MTIQNRLKKLESETRTANSDLCHCPDAIALVATPFAELCFRCGREIKVETWTCWQMVYPSADAMFFAFAMRRDDTDALVGKPNEFFIDEIKTMLKSEDQKETEGN